MPAYVPRSWHSTKDDPPEQTASTRRAALADRKERFADINDMCIRTGGAWLTSVSGDIEVTLVCIPTSVIPQRLRDQGYHLVDDGPGTWLAPNAITEVFGRLPDGTLVAIEPGSTLPMVQRVTHAGIIEVQRFSFLL
jgi:hypothetical protein